MPLRFHSGLLTASPACEPRFDRITFSRSVRGHAAKGDRYAALLAAQHADDRACVRDLAGEGPGLPVRQLEHERAVLDAHPLQRLIDLAEGRADQLAAVLVLCMPRKLELDVEIERRDRRPADPAALEHVREAGRYGGRLGTQRLGVCP